MVLGDVLFIPAALWTAITLKFDAFDHDVGDRGWLYVLALGASLITFGRLGLYRAVIRFLGLPAAWAILAGVTFSAVLLLGVNRLLTPQPLPVSTFVIYWALALVYVAGSRYLVRLVFASGNGADSRVAIYGAGDAGARLAIALQGSREFRPVFFVDDNPALHGSEIAGLRVYSPERLPQLLKDLDATGIVLAMPGAPRSRRRDVLRQLEPLGVRVQSLPDLSDIMTGAAKFDEVRDVDVKDLLGRDPVAPDPKLFESCVRGKSVLVTGAGGSIGSELCRQILRLAPRRLVLFEVSELALYTIEMELKEISLRENLSVEIIPLLGNAHHRHRVREVLLTLGVQTVYHAAAYKHVPIVEYNVIEGIHNNVISTWYTAEAALDAEVETFVLVSTDKAVNPANVMGATKRLAELVLQALQPRATKTKLCMVRFGNVLASSGSVVPLFQEQIRKGGPITVTHPEVIRYFMTIPEAAQLVIQAGSMARGGDVFVLDMGRPVKIDDLARRLIHLHGLTVQDADNPEGDIEIQYTGLRAAEKLYEELLIGTNVTGTDHPMILRAMEHSLPWERMEQVLDELLIALASFDCPKAVAILGESVAEYRQTVELRDHVWTRKSRPVVLPVSEPSKVADIATKRRQSEVGPRPN
jgi:FlaA1/EpsC-like NDP-sugar epimerase